MAFRTKQPNDEMVIDLTGPDGNAFALMAYAKSCLLYTSDAADE